MMRDVRGTIVTLVVGGILGANINSWINRSGYPVMYYRAPDTRSEQTDTKPEQTDTKLEQKSLVEVTDSGLTDQTFPGHMVDDPKLLSYVKQLIRPPSALPYNLTHPERTHFSQYTQSQLADQLLNGMERGFFIEAGALDGESFSNSLFFERSRMWSGLLVEPDPDLYRQVVSLNRKAFSINGAFAFTNMASMENFRPARGLGKLVPNANDGVPTKVIPLFTILAALKVTQVDFFSLDIEGAEMKVLGTIPWDTIKFRLICLEVNHLPGGRLAATKFFESKGYFYLGQQHIDAWYGHPELLKDTLNLAEYPKHPLPLLKA